MESVFRPCNVFFEPCQQKLATTRCPMPLGELGTWNIVTKNAQLLPFAWVYSVLFTHHRKNALNWKPSSTGRPSKILELTAPSIWSSWPRTACLQYSYILIYYTRLYCVMDTRTRVCIDPRSVSSLYVAALLSLHVYKLPPALIIRTSPRIVQPAKVHDFPPRQAGQCWVDSGRLFERWRANPGPNTLGRA